MRVDGQSIGIVKDKEISTCIGYFFEADLWGKYLRFQSRPMKIGEYRRLLRLDKETLGAKLLYPMAGDDAGSRFDKAISKVLKEFRSTGFLPDRTQFASG